MRLIATVEQPVSPITSSRSILLKYDLKIEKELGLDGIRESVLYLAAVGTFPAGKLRSNR